MKLGSSLGGIPVVSAAMRPRHGLHWARRGLQIGIIILAILIPVAGVFRVDPVDGAFVVLDRQIWFADFFIVFGFWLAVASGLVLTYSWLGTAFCGWVCPQNTLSEWSNHLMHKFLGRRAELTLDGERVKVSAAKNKFLNWLALGLIFLVTAMFFALIPLFYFYAPDIVWSFITLRDDARLAPSIHYIYSIFVIILFLNIAFIRHFFCRFMCVYKVWQHGFKTKQTLHVYYDASRAAECAKCNLCVTSCFVGIDPKKTETFDACVVCGECITACNNLHAKKGKTGLLKFEVGERASDKARQFKNNVGSILGRVRWTLPITAIGVAMFAWGLWDYAPHHLSVYRAQDAGVMQPLNYRINVVNKMYHPAQFQVSITGLAPQQYSLSAHALTLQNVGRADVQLTVAPSLAPGIYPILVTVSASDGWREIQRIQHVVTRG
ncbi:MAG: 4Fe-4S binding protein [Pseudomonadota bacterium]